MNSKHHSDGIINGILHNSTFFYSAQTASTVANTNTIQDAHVPDFVRYNPIPIPAEAAPGAVVPFSSVPLTTRTRRH